MIVTLINPYQITVDPPKGSTTISVPQLPELKKHYILQYLVTHQLLDQSKINTVGLVTCNPRNYFIDVLLAKNEEFYYDEESFEQTEAYKMKILISCPLSMTLYEFDEQNKIDCQNQNFSIKHFQQLKKIGEGTYSQIFLVERKYDRHLFCMKRINKAECRQKGQLEMIKNEFQIMQISLKYKIKLYYQFQDPKYVYFIIDYCPFGDLYSLIHNNKKADENNRLTLTQKYIIWIEVAFAIISLHQRGIVYRDLKPENILIDYNDRVKLCDFGFTCKIEPNQKLNSLCGSYEYLAPEMIKKEGYNKSIDLYCLGILFYEILLGSSPFQGITPKNIMQMKTRPIILDKKNISVTAKDLIRKLTKQRPEQRIGYESSLDVFKHDFFKENEDIIHRIVDSRAFLKNIKYHAPPTMQERQELDQTEQLIFPKAHGYNYMQPFFDVTENVGPKFQSNQ